MDKIIKKYLWIAGILVIFLLMIRGCTSCGCGKSTPEDIKESHLENREESDAEAKEIGDAFIELTLVQIKRIQSNSPYQLTGENPYSNLRKYYLDDGKNSKLQLWGLFSWRNHCR